MIKLKNIDKTFQGKKVLNNLSLTLSENDAVGLIGRSGAGKSTILRIISGLVQPDSGIIDIKSKKIGYIFQESNLIPWRTVLGNLYFPLQALGFEKKLYKKMAASWLERIELKGFEHYYPSQLSGGMRQRVAIARAFSIYPDILLMDEPFSALDPDLKKVMHNLMKEVLHEWPSTVLYVSHNINEVTRITDRIFTLTNKGRLIKTKK